MKILVRNLDRKTKEDQLERMFQEFGEVRSCSLVMDEGRGGASKGFAFVEMPNVSEAKAAIHKLNNKTVGNNKIRVKTTKN